MENIDTAPKDGTIIFIFDPETKTGMNAFWNKRRKQWEGKIVGVMGIVKVKWDKDSPIQPKKWRPI